MGEKFDEIDYVNIDKLTEEELASKYSIGQLKHMADLLSLEYSERITRPRIAVMIKKALYYDPTNIDATGANIRMIIGERSNGKTYAMMKKIIENYLEKGEQSAFVRRYALDITKARAEKMVSAHLRNGILDGTPWSGISFRSNAWYLTKYDEDLQKTVFDCQPFCFAYALATSLEHDKGGREPNVTICVFDEFISRKPTAPDEFIDWSNLLSTIAGNRGNVVVYMCANTVNKFSPYFTEMGLRHVKFQKQGTIDTYAYDWVNEATGQKMHREVAVEYCKTSPFGKASDVFFAFDNPKLKMITGGEWELAMYPHCPIKHMKQSEIVFTYFVRYDGEVLQCEVARRDNKYFTYCHRKTTPMKDEDHDLIFSLEPDARRNWRRWMCRPTDKLGQKIWRFYQEDKVYYQDNEVGETMRMYLQTAMASGIIKA